MKNSIHESDITHTDPQILQGGMGVRISSPELAGTVAKHNGLGFVSGTAIDVVLARTLQEGDREATIRDILVSFPNQSVVKRALDEYYIDGGVNYANKGVKYKAVPMHAKDQHHIARDLTVLGAYTEVMLAKRYAGDSGYIGINLLTKIERPTVYALYGAMLAGVDYVEMGAGVPYEVPKVIKQLAQHKIVTYPYKVGKSNQKHELVFDPAIYNAGHIPIKLPRFLAVVAKEDLATHLATAEVPPYGFVVENSTAGGHNAPPRGSAKDEKGQPLYSEQDQANIATFVKLGMPFWLAGGYGGRMGLRTARQLGANGVQIGSVFALSQESGLRPDLKDAIVKAIFSDNLEILTDARVSPTGFPFKIANILGSIAHKSVYEARKRVCDIGHLQESITTVKGDIVQRCPAEPETSWARNGGLAFRLGGVACLCNGLLSTANFAQVRNGVAEAPLVTLGDNVIKEAREHGQPLTVARIMNSILLAANIRANHPNK